MQTWLYEYSSWRIVEKRKSTVTAFETTKPLSHAILRWAVYAPLSRGEAYRGDREVLEVICVD